MDKECVCQRCNRVCQNVDVLSPSAFDRKKLCPVCLSKEAQHPKFAKAREMIQDEISKGNYDFPGMGLPKDMGGGP